MVLPPSISKPKVIFVVGFFGVCVALGIILGIVLPHFLNMKERIQSDMFISSSELGIYSSAAVSTDAAPCAAVGKDIFERNGTAVDSAIATLLCMGVVNLHSMGIGGGFLMTIFNSESGDVEILDARETAPEMSSEDMFNENPEASTLGGLSVAIPGEIKGYYKAHSRYGRLKWKDLFESAIDLSRNGFPIGKHLAAAIQTERNAIMDNEGLKDLLFNAETKNLYLENDILKNVELSKTLEKISEGYDNFYKGEIADSIIDDIKKSGGIISKKDLENYDPLWKKPVTLDIGFGKLYSVPTPGSGPLLAFMINILQMYNLTDNSLKTKEETIKTYQRIAETFKFAYARRMELGDGDPGSENLVVNLTSDAYAQSIKEKIWDNRTFNDPAYYGVKTYSNEEHGTAHLSVVAPNGDAVAVTSTINLYFGSKLRSKKTGILFNNEMDDFSSPNITNAFNIPPSESNYIKPGRRPLSSMVPTIIVDNEGNAKMVVGGNGGSHITTGTALVILRALFFNETIKEAIDAPRFHHQLFPNHIIYEKNFDKDILRRLQNFGHNITELKGRGAVIMGIVRGKNGLLYANADYRKGGKTEGF